jgi:hyperosmotically inducible protein
MRFVFKSVIHTFLCAVLLLGSAAFAGAQQPADQQSAPAADNTKVNERDKNQNEPTASQQKENPTDRAVTQQIRKSLMDDKSLSTYAQNVKIITQDGQVTLKGPVRSEAEKHEKQMIEQKAAEVAGKDKVTSELDVKPQQ